jgi:hypothetical protein
MEKKINTVVKPIPSAPYAQSITVSGDVCKKGGSAMTSKLPEKHMIPGPSKKK